uniref:myocardial zonula adherens protein-like isoform X1 n=1 Tax=Myxine glutinosa TaxID=7769 RepID=UPI00358ED7BE
MYRLSSSHSKSVDSGIHVPGPENRGQARPTIQPLQPTQNIYAHQGSGHVHNNIFIQGLQSSRHVITGSHGPILRRCLSDNNDSFHGTTPLVSQLKGITPPPTSMAWAKPQKVAFTSEAPSRALVRRTRNLRHTTSIRRSEQEVPDGGCHVNNSAEHGWFSTQQLLSERPPSHEEQDELLASPRHRLERRGSPLVFGGDSVQEQDGCSKQDAQTVVCQRADWLMMKTYSEPKQEQLNEIQEQECVQLQRELVSKHEEKQLLVKAHEDLSRDYTGMEEKIKSLLQDLEATRKQLEKHQTEMVRKEEQVKEYSKTNSMLQESTLHLQKSLAQATLLSCNLQQQQKELGKRHSECQEHLQGAKDQLVLAHNELRTLKTQLEACKEANESAVREAVRCAGAMHQEQLCEEQNMHRTQMEAVVADRAEIEQNLLTVREECEGLVRQLSASERRTRELERLLKELPQEHGVLENDEQFEERAVEQQLSEESLPSASELHHENETLQQKIHQLHSIIIAQDRKIWGALDKSEILKDHLETKDTQLAALKHTVTTLKEENEELRRGK